MHIDEKSDGGERKLERNQLDVREDRWNRLTDANPLMAKICVGQ